MGFPGLDGMGLGALQNRVIVGEVIKVSAKDVLMLDYELVI